MSGTFYKYIIDYFVNTVALQEDDIEATEATLKGEAEELGDLPNIVLNSVNEDTLEVEAKLLKLGDFDSVNVSFEWCDLNVI